MEDIDKIEKIFNVEYSDTVKYAVRYGYNYRIEAEQKHNSYSHACLPDTSAILLWLGQKVIDGVIWDLFKVAAKKLYEMFDKSNSYLSEELSKFLSDEQDLKRFYTYVKEFNEQNMTVTEEQFTYIREEIWAQVRKSVDSPPGMLTEDHHHTVHEERQVCYSSHLRPKSLHL